MLKNTGGYMLKNTIRFVSYNFPTHFTIVPMASDRSCGSYMI